jgi:hypothetical protein
MNFLSNNKSKNLKINHKDIPKSNSKSLINSYSINFLMVLYDEIYKYLLL